MDICTARDKEKNPGRGFPLVHRRWGGGGGVLRKTLGGGAFDGVGLITQAGGMKATGEKGGGARGEGFK